MRYIVEQGRPRVQAEHGLVRVLRGQTVHRVDFGAHSNGGSAGGSGDLLDDVRGGANHPSTASTTCIEHSGCTITLTPGYALAGTFDLFDGETPVHGASPSTVILASWRGRNRPDRRRRPCALNGSHSGISLSGMPIARAVLRPRCWSGRTARACRGRTFQHGVRIGRRCIRCRRCVRRTPSARRMSSCR